MSNICSIKLVTGEEIVGRSENPAADIVVVTNPKSVQLMRAHDGMAMALMPVLNASPDIDRIQISQHQIAYYATSVSKDVETNYIKQVSGIQLA